MISTQIFLLGLLTISTLTGLVTEAVKNILTERGKTYHSNTLAGVVATILSIAVAVGYILLNDIGFNVHSIVYTIALVFLSWLCSMVGYDKVVQTINQFKMV